MAVDTQGQARVRVRVHTRVVFSERLGQRFERKVVCPRHGVTMHVQDCFSCRAFKGITGPDASGAKTITCAVRPEELRAVAEDRTPTVEQLMRPDVVCVEPGLGVDELIEVFEERGVGGVPVVNAEGLPVGFVSKGDIIGASRSGDTERPQSVVDVMTRALYSIPATSTVGHAATVMVTEDVDRLPVVADTGELVGMLAARDIVRWVADGAGAERQPATILG